MLETVLQGTQPPIRGIVLGMFGAGNAPLSSAFLDMISTANARGITIVDSTQVIKGTVNITAYQTGSGLLKAGAISGYDLTPEAVLTKLIYLIARGLDQHEIKVQMQTELRGEMTIPHPYYLSACKKMQLENMLRCKSYQIRPDSVQWMGSSFLVKIFFRVAFVH
jgi:hypothetical protein